MAKLVKAHGNNQPNIINVKFYNEIPVYAAINLNIIKNEYGFSWDELILPEFALENIYTATNEIKKNVLISHIIKAYYNDNEMTAIINNYLVDSENPEYKAEFLAMQNIRKIAKETAKYIVSNGLF